MLGGHPVPRAGAHPPSCLTPPRPRCPLTLAAGGPASVPQESPGSGAGLRSAGRGRGQGARGRGPRAPGRAPRGRRVLASSAGPARPGRPGGRPCAAPRRVGAGLAGPGEAPGRRGFPAGAGGAAAVAPLLSGGTRFTGCNSRRPSMALKRDREGAGESARRAGGRRRGGGRRARRRGRGAGGGGREVGRGPDGGGGQPRRARRGGGGGGPLPAAPAHPRPVPRKDWRRWWGYASPPLNRPTSPQPPRSQIPPPSNRPSPSHPPQLLSSRLHLRAPCPSPPPPEVRNSWPTGPIQPKPCLL